MFWKHFLYFCFNGKLKFIVKYFLYDCITMENLIAFMISYFIAFIISHFIAFMISHFVVFLNNYLKNYFIKLCRTGKLKIAKLLYCFLWIFINKGHNFGKS